jgi:hypothetical protein
MEDVSPETIAAAGLVLSIVPPGEAIALARGLVTPLRESSYRPVYIDCNALSPKTKTEIARILAETGCDILDGAIVGAPPQPEGKGPRIYVSGNHSDRASVLSTMRHDCRQKLKIADMRSQISEHAFVGERFHLDFRGLRYDRLWPHRWLKRPKSAFCNSFVTSNLGTHGLEITQIYRTFLMHLATRGS